MKPAGLLFLVIILGATAFIFKDNLLKQLNSTVLWSDCVGFMIKQGVDEFFEVGPGKVLKGLMHKINPQAKVVNIEKKEDAEQL